MEKRLAIVTGDDVKDVVISPGTETREILRQLDLPEDYWLTTRDQVKFQPSEIVYGMVDDGDKLFASAPATVGV